MAKQIVVSADPDAIDEDLRRRLYPVLHLESVGFCAAGQVMIRHLESLAFEEVARFQSIGAGVIRHHHAV